MPDATGSTPAGWSVIPQGDRTLLLVLGHDMDVAVGRRCAAAAAALRSARLDGVTDIVPTFNAVALHYQPRLCGAHDHVQHLISQVETILNKVLTSSPQVDAARQIDIPVCYGGEYGPDLEEVARYCKLDPQEVVHLHSHTPAYVFMLGFAPGAAYIGVHDEKLAIGRRDTPRTCIPAGSVAIANRQTMIYPNASPGGWHIIGTTSAVLFDPAHEPPTLLSPGDTVNFVPVSPDALLAMDRPRP